MVNSPIFLADSARRAALSSWLGKLAGQTGKFLRMRQADGKLARAKACWAGRRPDL